MNIEKQIEFDKIKEKWQAFAATERAKEKINNWSFCLSESEFLDGAEDLRDESSRQIRNREVDDYASKNLLQIRKQIVKCEEQMKQKAGQIMNTNKKYMADNYYTFRNKYTRFCIHLLQWLLPGQNWSIIILW